MNRIPFNSIEPLLSSSLAEVEAACGKVTSSFDELIGSAMELASAERRAQSVINSVPDDEEEHQQVNDALSLREDAKFEMAIAIDRALSELVEQERVLNDTRAALEQMRESLQLRSHELFPSMELGPKPGCVCQ